MLFKLDGIVIDSYSQILIVDSYNKRIYILDLDGYFFCYIVVDKLDCLFSLCVDIKNILFVVGKKSGKIKMINYI